MSHSIASSRCQCPNDAFLFQFTFYVSKLCDFFLVLHRKLFIFIIIIIIIGCFFDICRLNSNNFSFFNGYIYGVKRMFLFFFSIATSTLHIHYCSFSILTGWPNAQRSSISRLNVMMFSHSDLFRFQLI